MRFLAHDFHHDGLVHAVGYDLADDLLAPSCLSRHLILLCVCLGHYFFSVVPAAASSCSRMMVFTRAMSLRRPRIFFRLSVCPMLSWNFSLNSWSLSSRSWWRSSSLVKLRTFSGFINGYRFLVLSFQCAASRFTKAVRKPSLCDARRMASKASCGVTPSISNKILPGRTTATQ